MMNVLVNDKIMEDKDDLVVVYDIKKDGGIDCACMINKYRTRSSIPSKNYFDELFSNLLAMMEDPYYVVNYSYERGCYKTYIINEKIMMAMKVDREPIRNVTYVEIVKEIN
jgi:hypothetical protein